MGGLRRAAMVLGALSLRAASVGAQDAAAEAARRELVSQAERASDAGEHARALELLTRAAQVRTSPSLRQFIAEESAEVGDWHRAYVESVQCQREASTDDHLSHRREIRRACERVEARARPRVGQVVVQAPTGVTGLRLRVAGTEVPSALWGVRYPVAAGTIVIEAAAADGRTYRDEIRVPEGQERVVAIVLSTPTPPPIAPTTTPEREPEAPPPPTVIAVSMPTPAADATPSRGPLRTGAWVALGLGGAGLVTGVVATVMTYARAEDFNAMAGCGQSEANQGAPGCSAAYDRVTSAQGAAIAGWVLAGVGAAGGAAMLLLAPRADHRRASRQVDWLVGPGLFGAGVRVAF